MLNTFRLAYLLMGLGYSQYLDILLVVPVRLAYFLMGLGYSQYLDVLTVLDCSFGALPHQGPRQRRFRDGAPAQHRCELLPGPGAGVEPGLLLCWIRSKVGTLEQPSPNVDSTQNTPALQCVIT